MASTINTKSSGVSQVDLDYLKEAKGKDTLASGVSFDQALTQQVENAAKKADAATPKVTEKPLLKFSNHAVERMNSRGIVITPEQITKIEQGMQKAQAKGGKEALVLTDNSALIVSLKSNTVVTVMDRASLKENVFTNIDTTVFV